MQYLDSRHRRLSEAILTTDIRLCLARHQCSNDGRVPLAPEIVFSFDCRNSTNCDVSLVGLDLHIRSADGKQSQTFFSGTCRKTEQTLIPAFDATPILFDSSKTGTPMNRTKRCRVRVRYANANALRVGIALNAALAIEQAGNIRREGFVAIFRDLHERYDNTPRWSSMAVPVVRWIGQRIQQLEDALAEKGVS
jgi:hypothetical protein